jgi:hypothetical protein
MCETIVLNIIDLGVIFAIFMLSLICIAVIKSNFYRGFLILNYHIFFAILYNVFVCVNGGDALTYYFEAEKEIHSGVEFLGSDFIFLVNYYLKSGGVGFVGVSAIFSFIGFIGILYFDTLLYRLKDNFGKYSALVRNVIIFMPSMHFWSTGIGKEPIAFLSGVLFSWSILNRKFGFFVIALLLMLFIRPHIAGLMTVAFVLGEFVLFLYRPSRYKILTVFIYSSSMVVFLATVINFALSFLNLRISKIQAFFVSRENIISVGGGSIDLLNENAFFSFIYYLFRPFFYDAKSVFMVVNSFENLLLLIIFILLPFSSKVFNYLYFIRHPYLHLFIFSASTLLFSSLITNNAGIAVRHKWTIIPALVVYFVLPSVLLRFQKNKGSNVSPKKLILNKNINKKNL